MADRGNVPDSSEVDSISGNEDSVVVDEITNYPRSTTYQPLHFNIESSENEPNDYYRLRRSEINSRNQPCWASQRNVTGKGENDEDITENSETDVENSLKSSESGNEMEGSCDYVEYLSLNADGGSDKTGKKEEDDTMDTVEVASDEGYDEEDEPTGQKNSFTRFLECSNSFIRNMMRKACDFTPPRE